MMKFLIDMPASPLLAKWLNDQGHDAIHAKDVGLATASDATILATAREENRIIITVDLDYSGLLAKSGFHGPGVILFRGGNYSEREMKELLGRVLAQAPSDTLSNSISVVDKKRVRIRRLPVHRG